MKPSRDQLWQLEHRLVDIEAELELYGFLETSKKVAEAYKAVEAHRLEVFGK